MKPASGSSKLNTLFGRPYNPDMSLNTHWEKANIILIDLPFTMRIAWNTAQRVTRIRVHRSVAKAFEQAFNDVWQKTRYMMKQKYGFSHDTTFYDNKAAAYLRLLGLDLYGGAYEYRKMRKSQALSNHSYGIAIDIDPSHNPMGKRKSTFPDWYVASWKAAGFDWGGAWQKRPDPMHFERLKPCS